MKTKGEIAYEAYCKSTDGRSLISGAALPLWHEQFDGVKLAWEQAALAVVYEVCKDCDKECVNFIGRE